MRCSRSLIEKARRVLAISLLFICAICSVQSLECNAAEAPVHQIDGKPIREWLLLGPFISKNFSSDFLIQSGGEKKIRPAEGDAINTPDGSSLIWSNHTSKQDFVDIVKVLGSYESATIYAFCELESETAGETFIEWMGSRTASIWINGEHYFYLSPTLTHRIHPSGTAIPLLKVSLKKGRNTCLVKIPEISEHSGFSLKFHPMNGTTIEGTIMEPTGGPAAGALLRLFQGRDEVMQTKADDQGNYRLSLFPSTNRYDLKVTLDSVGTWRTNLLSLTRQSHRLDIKLDDSVSISGSVLTMNGRSPQTSIPVQLLELAEDGYTERLIGTALSNERGEYRFVAVRPGAYRLRCHTIRGFHYYNSPEIGSETPQQESTLVVGDRPLRRINFRLPQIKKGFWRSYSTYDGLPVQSISSINALANGPIYLGLNGGGLCEFDGAHFKTIEQVEGMTGAYVVGLAPTLDGALWLAAGDDGLIRFEGKRSKSFTQVNGLAGNSVRRVFVDRQGGTWIGTSLGLTHYDGRQFVNYRVEEGLPGNLVLDICQTQDGAHWIASNNGVTWYDGNEFVTLNPNRDLPSRRVLSVFEATDTSVWFGTDHGAVQYLDGKLRRYTVRDGLPGNQINDIVQTHEGHLWFATDQGLSRFTGTAFVNYTVWDGLVHNEILNIHQGSDRCLWLATHDGLARFDPAGMVQWTDKDGLLSSDGKLAAISSMEIDSDGQILIGTSDGVFRCDGRRVLPFANLSKLTEIAELHRAADDTLWVASRGLWKYKSGILTSVLPNQNIFTLHSDSKGNIWFGAPGANGGLWRFDPQSETLKRFSSADGLPHESIWGLHGGRDGTMWIGSYAGLFSYDGEEFIDQDDRRAPDDTEGLAVWAIHEDEKSTITFGGSGVLGRYDGANFTWLDEKMSLAQPKVWDVTQTPDGIHWVATANYGLVGFDGKAFTVIDSRDGLAGKNARAVIGTKQGQVWTGTRDGGLTLYERRGAPPSIQLVSAEVDDTIYTNFPPHLGVVAGRRVTIHCREIDFKTHAQKRQFYYRVRTGENHTVTSGVTFERLINWTPREAGEYLLEVQAIDRDLIYSPAVQLSFHVVQPWYLNAWIAVPTTGGILGLVLFSSITGWRYVVHRKQAEKLQEQMLRQERHARKSLEDSNRRLEEAKAVAEEAREAAEEAKESSELANRAKSIFLANMSHEIRTPLNAILGYAQILLRDQSLKGQQREAINTVERSGTHLLRLINEILDLSKIESGRMELSLSDFDLRELILETCGMLESRCREKGLKWQIAGLGDVSIPVRGDEGKLRQILINLLGNAIKFTDVGSVTFRLQKRQENIYGFEVIDTGPGIPPETQKKIFEPFTQGSEGKSKGGTGLGLTISKRQIELMGGELKLESELGKGARFYFSLELLPAKSEVVAKSRRNEKRLEKLQKGSTARTLVVDDIKENRDLLAQFLLNLGLHVDTADGGKEALQKLHTERYDIVFLDIQMPDMSGIEVAERVLAEFGSEAIKLVAVSASVLTHERERYEEIGFHGFIPKPFRLEEICDGLEQLLGLKFEYETTASPLIDNVDTAPATPVSLPKELLDRLKTAAESYAVTEFESYLAEMDVLDESARHLARQLRQLSRNVKIEEILTILNGIEPH